MFKNNLTNFIWNKLVLTLLLKKTSVTLFVKCFKFFHIFLICANSMKKVFIFVWKQMSYICSKKKLYLIEMNF